MFEDWDFLFLADFVEIVHIELSYEGRKLLMFEILGQNLILKEILVFYDKAIAIISPLNDMTILLVLQNLIGLHYEIGDLLSAVHPLLIDVGLGSIELLGLEFLALLW